MYSNIRKEFLVKIVIVLFFLLSIGFLSSENIYADPLIKEGIKPSFELIDRDFGLSNLSVSSIVQDKYGFIWFGTQGGLNRYDGRQMKVFRQNPFKDNGLIHNLIQTLYYDEEKHELWIGTYQGLSHLDIENNTFENYTVDSDGLSNSVAIAITKDEHDNIWIGTMDGLNKLNPKTGEIKAYEIPGNVVRDLKIDSMGRLLIGSYEGLLYYEKEKDRIERFELDLPSPYVMVIKEFQKGIITLGLWDGGVANVDMATGEVKTRRYKNNNIYSITQTRDGIQWIGTWGGGLYATTSDGETYHYPGNGKEQSLVHPVVYSMYQDHSDILWIGTNGGGINKVNPRKSNYVKFSHDPEEPNSLSNGKINKIFQDSRGSIWFAIYNAGLNRYDPIKKKIIKYEHNPNEPDSLSSNQVIDILETKEDKLLLGTGAGLLYYDMNTQKFSTLDILPEDVMVYAIEKAGKSIYWIGTYRNGIYRYNEGTGELKHFKHISNNKPSLSDNLVYDILHDSKDRLWVATNNGLNLSQPGLEEFKTYHKISGNYDQLASNTIRVLYEDSKGRIWIGTVGGGIALYNEKKDSFESFIEENGMSSNVVLGILEGEDGRIWASTHNGISIIDPKSKEIFVLTPDDGIGGWEFNSGHFKDDHGTLMFGGIHGISAIPSTFADVDTEPPRVYITDIDLYQNPIEEDRVFFNDAKLKFGPNDSFLSFKFVALDFDSPEKNKFSYKLEGFDKEWINAGTRDYASYSNLPPGDYELKVVAETSRNILSEPVSVHFNITTPWFKTKWAYFLYCISFVVLILIGFKLRELNLLNKRNSKLSILNKKLKDANDELERLSTKDSLTGLFNRRYFDTVINEQLDLAKRSKTYLTLIMLDIDNFKDINDRYGHVAGDYFLSDISKAISKIVPRSTDFIARYGGDEFGIVLYDTDSEGGLIVANSIKRAAEKTSVRKEFSSSKQKTTVSMGLVSLIPDKDTTVKMIVQTADEALYHAKKEGRNRICIKELNFL